MKTRRHHNNDGRRMIRNGSLALRLARLARRLERRLERKREKGATA